MTQEIIFMVYIILLAVLIIMVGINFYRIRDKKMSNPQILLFLLPFIINYVLAKSIFYEINPLFTTIFPCILIFFIGKKLKSVRIFGLTGGIATGKSTLGKQMKTNLTKLTIIDCDQINKRLRNKGQKGYNLILSLLGDKSSDFIQTDNKQIKVEKFSNFVFENPRFRKQLTLKMTRLIFWQIIKQLFKSIISRKHLIMIDAPTLYQSKVLQYFCYPIIVVGCSQQVQIKRLLERNKYSRQEALNRIKAQMPIAIKQKKADIYIKNQSTQQQLLKNTLTKLNKFLHKD